ncbi:MAG: signal peptidase I, partial [Pseudomonadota bacterium]
MSLESSGSNKLKDSFWWETGKIIIQALILAMIVRIFFYQPFNIPSGSMKSTLLVGDYLFVSKYSYGYSKYSFPLSPDIFSGRIWSGTPERGDVAVFRLPTDTNID